MDKTKLSSIYEAPLPTQLRIHIDEAGRWPLAGPVSVWCTLSLQQADLSDFCDSKSISERRRETLYGQIQDLESQGIIHYASWRASNKQIDEKGIIPALQYACVRGIFLCLKKYFVSQRAPALAQSVYGEDHMALAHLSRLFATNTVSNKKLRDIFHTPNTVAVCKGLIIDGNHTFWLDTALDTQVITIIKGDAKNPLISMASIIAKVERDRRMKKISKKLSEYGLDQHKWYGTKKHRQAIATHWVSQIHRQTFCGNTWGKKNKEKRIRNLIPKQKNILTPNSLLLTPNQKPKLLLHICCAPDLSRPLHWLKNHFKLYLFLYNPNIHPRAEHTKRYDSFIKLIGLERGDYEIVEDWYDPKEFFQAMIDEKEDIDPSLKNASDKEALKVAGEMEERSSRCNPCYSMRLAEAAKNAAKHDIPYFTSTLLISPKKKMDKLFRRGIEGERRHPSTKFLWFNFAKNKWYEHATRLTKKHWLFRQNYCGCGWTIPKPGDDTSKYTWG